MRLTLRTMLAYLDDILDPQDSDVLGRKIEESEFASTLVHRIRGSIRRLRLAAPKIDGKGIGADANTVAEYLDNTMPAERVPDFEKVCLESEIHLAEVASCHQILTLVLGEPAEVPVSTRHRVYELSRGKPIAGEQTKHRPHVPLTTGTPEELPARTGPTFETAKAKRKLPEVPDYLRKKKRPVWKLPVAVAALAFLLASVGILMMGPLNQSHPVAQLLALSPKTVGTPLAPADTVSENKPNRQSYQIASANDEQQPVDDADSSTELFTDNGPEMMTHSVEVPTEHDKKKEDVKSQRRNDAELIPVQPSEMAFPNSSNGNVGTATERLNVESGNWDGKPQTPDSTELSPVEVVPEETKLPPLEVALTANEKNELDTESLSTADSLELGSALEQPSDSFGVHTDQFISNGIGHFTSDRQEVLVRLAKDDSAVRLASRARLVDGDTLLSLPVFRPQILLTNKVQLTMVGGTLIHLRRLDNNVPNVSVPFGRLSVMAFGQANSKISVNVGSVTGLATFVGADSAMSIEVRRTHYPGTNPERKQPHVVIEVIATSGSISWQTSDNDSIAINAGEKLTSRNGELGVVTEVGTLPDWINGHDATGIAQRTAREIEPLLLVGESVTLPLEELTAHRKIDHRSIASRSLVLLGRFEPLLATFGDGSNRSTWRLHFDSLQDALARGSDGAALLRNTIEKMYGGDSEMVYRMLWGYGPEDLAEGADVELVNQLDHRRLELRVFAIENLRRITGGDRHYRPHYRAAERKLYRKKWENLLKSGQIVYKEPPPS